MLGLDVAIGLLQGQLGGRPDWRQWNVRPKHVISGLAGRPGIRIGLRIVAFGHPARVAGPSSSRIVAPSERSGVSLQQRSHPAAAASDLNRLALGRDGRAGYHKRLW